MLLKVNSDQMFHEVDSFAEDNNLTSLIKDCIEAQKEIGLKQFEKHFKPNSQARYHTSPEALAKILQQGNDISDIRTHTDITNCIVFHTKNLDGSLLDERIFDLRRRADEVMIKKIKDIFDSKKDLSVEVSGQFWYPAGGFMGWHTNLRKPGWRMYVNYTEEEGKSFFRYRDPDSHDIITCHDKNWNFRLFKITPEKPFWHCVSSDTNRFSLGYKIELVDA